MPSTAMPAAILVVISASWGWAWPSAAARRRTSSVRSSSRHGGAHSRRHRLDGALVGDRERADLLDLVAPELHPHRVLLGRREDVDEPAAHGELAALLHQVDAGVRRVRETAYDVVDGDGVARGELDRLEVTEPADLRLQDRADRRDHHPEPARSRRRCRGGAAGGAPRDGVPIVSLRGLSRSCGSVSQLG